MNLVVVVQGAKAAQTQLAGIATATRAVRGASVGAAVAGRGMGDGMRGLTRGMEKYGKNMQWVGRQIEYNFTLPIVIATGFATKWALANEAAMVRLRKVYGSSSMPTKQYTEETEALGRAFRFLSDNFGTALDEVIDSGADFAQAGAGNIAVANGVRAALELQILGEIELADATEAVIAIQAQYGVSSLELTQIIADLNSVENNTTASLDGLIVAMQRSAGVAREAGVPHQELAGMIAAMVPASGNANEAGNSLKTLITRIMVPTRRAKDALEGLGIATESLAWKNKTATGKFLELADALEEVSGGQRTMALESIAGKRQVSRLAVLMRDLRNENGRYATALEVTADAEESVAEMHRELDIFLRSGPQGFKILTTQIKNYSAEIAAQLIPTMLAVLGQIRDWVRAFAELDPQVRSTILSLILLVAVVGPFVRIMGSLILLITQLVKFPVFLAKGLVSLAMGFGWLLIRLSKIPGMLWWVAKEIALVLAWIFTKAIVPAISRIATYITATMVPAFARAAAAAWAWAASTAAAALAGGRAFIASAAVGVVTGLKAMILWLGRASKAAFVWAGQMVAAQIIAAGPIGWIIAGVVALVAALGTVLWIFRDQVIDAFRTTIDWVVGAWQTLTSSVANVMRGVVMIVRAAARQVIDLFAQMLNPFGRRQKVSAPQVSSPPEARAAGGPVRKGNQYIIGENGPELFTSSSSGNIASNDALQAFQRATASARDRMQSTEMAQIRSDITSVAPGSGAGFDAAVDRLRDLERALVSIKSAYESQERVVGTWRDKLDAANVVLDAANDKLDLLRERASAAGDALSSSQTELDRLAGVPISGMREMGDAIWGNEQAQKRLRLEMLKLEEVNGPIDDIQNKLAGLQGDIEMLSGKRENLRLAGAGSDVLGAFDQQIDQLKQAQSELMGGGGSGPAQQMEALEKQMADLRREAEMMNLEKELKFDPLTRQIERMVDGYEEMPFDDIVASIQDQQKEVERLTKEYEAAEGAVTDQEKVIKQLTKARDEIEDSYNRELDLLDDLDDAYNDVKNEIQELESAIKGFGSDASKELAEAAAAADAAAAAAEAATDAFGDFEIPGGMEGLEWEAGDIDDLLAEWEDEFGDMFGDFDLFESLREQWERFKEWWSGKLDSFTEWWSGKWDSFTEPFKRFWETIKTNWADALETIRINTASAWEAIKNAWNISFGALIEDSKEDWEEIKGDFRRVWGDIEGIFSRAVASIGRIWDRIKRKIRTPIAAVVSVAINPLIRGINSIARKVNLPEFSTITVPSFHKGGVVGKGGDPRNLGQHPIQSDEQLALLRNGERVLTKAERQYYEGDPEAMLPEVGHGVFDVFRNITSSVADSIRSLISSTVRPIINGAMNSIGSIAGGGTDFGETIKGVARYIGGGVVDWIAGIDREMPKVPELGTGIGYQAMWKAVSNQFPWARLTSGYRAGATTATGNPSYHASGRAVDVAGSGFMDQGQMLQMNKWIYDNYKAQTKELIYSGPNSKQINNGRDHYYSGITRSNHWDHVHWAMDNGGFLNQGWNQPIFNGTGKPEIVSPERLMRRIVREEVQRSGGGDRNITFTGDLSFPNVKDGNDAEDFVRNLETMVGS